MLLLGNMRCRRRNVILVAFCVLILMIYQAKADKEDKSEESPNFANQIQPSNSSPSTTKSTTISASTESLSTIDHSTASPSHASAEEGPPDSHEAMHNRELKPKLTVSRAGNGGDGDRNKRSYEFLMGLVRNQSGFEVTRAEKNGIGAASEGIDLTEEHNWGGTSYDKMDMKAAGDLMEILVKISSHPKEWKSVHDMLVEIDNDLQKSKRILDQIERSPLDFIPPTMDISINEKKSHTPEHHENINNKQKVHGQQQTWPVEQNFASNDDPRTSPQHNLETLSQRQNVNNHHGIDPTKVSYPQLNFAYHRVTGKPLYHHTNSNNKEPKAYIAVSVIAPKNPTERDEINLENELRQLKPWTHQQNLRNMADIRSKWVIQSWKENDDLREE